MNDPRRSAQRIILNNPDLADDLFALLAWADQPNLKENADYDEILNMLWVKTQKSREARDAYVKEQAAV